MTRTGGNQRLTIQAVRDRYREAGLSRTGASLVIGIPESTLRRFEAGASIRPVNARLIADYMGDDVRVADVMALATEAQAA